MQSSAGTRIRLLTTANFTKLKKMKPIKLPVSSRLILVAITSLIVTGTHARTWTSADGTKTFDGELKSYDPRIGVVTVALSSGTSMHFEQDKLAAADIAYLKTYLEEQRTKGLATSASTPTAAVSLKDLPDVWPPKDEKRYSGNSLKSEFTSDLKSLKEEISRALPKVGSKAVADLENAGKALTEALAKADAAQKGLGQIAGAKGLIDHAKGKWIGGANKDIATAQAALKNAKTPAEKDAAQKLLAAAQKNLAEGEAALKERTALYEKAKADESSLKQANEKAQAALTQAQAKRGRCRQKPDGIHELLPRYRQTGRKTRQGLCAHRGHPGRTRRFRRAKL